METLSARLIIEEVQLIIYLLLVLEQLVGCREYKKIVALSTTEAEYVAVTEAKKELIWLQGLLTELGFMQERCALYSDSQSAIHLPKNSAFHSRTNNIGLRYHFIRSLLEDEVLTLTKIQGSKNPADMLTKVVTIDKLKLCSTSVGLLE